MVRLLYTQISVFTAYNNISVFTAYNVPPPSQEHRFTFAKVFHFAHPWHIFCRANSNLNPTTYEVVFAREHSEFYEVNYIFNLAIETLIINWCLMYNHY